MYLRNRSIIRKRTRCRVGVSRSIQTDSVHHAHKGPIMDEELINLIRSKVFDRVDLRKLEVVLRSARLYLVFRGWVIASYCGIQSVVHVNGHLSKHFQITRSLRQICRLTPSLLQKQAMLGSIPRELGCGRNVSAYAKAYQK